MNGLPLPTEPNMPPRTLLSSEQRTRLFAIPTDAPEMTRHYVLDVNDLPLVGARRRAGNRLGFAIQLWPLRHPGRVLDPSESPPAPMLAFVARQIGVDPRCSANTLPCRVRADPETGAPVGETEAPETQ